MESYIRELEKIKQSEMNPTEEEILEFWRNSPFKLSNFMREMMEESDGDFKLKSFFNIRTRPAKIDPKEIFSALKLYILNSPYKISADFKNFINDSSCVIEDCLRLRAEGESFDDFEEDPEEDYDNEFSL